MSSFLAPPTALVSLLDSAATPEVAYRFRSSCNYVTFSCWVWPSVETQLLIKEGPHFIELPVAVIPGSRWVCTAANDRIALVFG